MGRGLQIFTSFCVLLRLVLADESKIPDAQSQENPCLGKHGVFLPKLGSCSEYWICVEGLTQVGSCGGDHFDARRGVCDLPSLAGCISFGPEPLPATQGICFDKKNGTKLPANNSSSRYFLCVEGNAQLADCGQLIFDRDAQECIGAPPKPLRPLLPPCSGKQNGARVPVEYDPRKYYLCMNNRPFLKSCGELFFSAKTASCSLQPDTEKEAKANQSGPIASAVVLPSKESAVRKEPIPAGKIALIVKSRPSRFDILPQEPPIREVVVASRPAGLDILPRPQEPPIREVVVASRPAGLDILPRPQEPSIREVVEQPAEIIESRPIRFDVLPTPEDRPILKDRLSLRMCQGQKFGARIPIPGTCSQYYICMGNTGLLKSCGQKQFNPQIGACDLASNVFCRVQQGVALYGSEDSAVDRQPHDSKNLTICQGQGDSVLIPAPGSCSQYYFCFRNTAHPKSCGKRHFSPITMSCVDLKLSKCVDAAAVQKPAAADVNCLSRANGVLLKHPTDCGKFLICDNHKPVEMICPEGLHFNVNRSVCDWPDQAKCS